MVQNSTVKTVAAIFKSRLLKMAAARKCQINQVEVASKIKHAVTTLVYTSYGIKISTFFEKNGG